MLRNIMRMGPKLSGGLSRAITAVAILAYIALYLAASAFLSGFVSRDSDKIQSQIGGSSTYEDTSFDAVAKFYSSLGDIGTTLFVLTVGSFFIALMIGYARRTGALVVNTLLMLPCVFFCLSTASKDTIVVFLSVLLVMIARRWNVRYVVSATILLYVYYALTVRIYFVLILAIGAGIWVLRASSPRVRMVLIIAALTALFLLPNMTYYILLHPRDMAVDYLVSKSPFGARTDFYNPWPPQGFLSFCLDYLYAVARLHCPVLFSPGPKELVMTGLMGIVIASVFAKTARGNAPVPSAEWLACVFIGHMAVSMLFEPDLGSYVRHLMSVTLFCAWRLSLLIPAQDTDITPDTQAE